MSFRLKHMRSEHQEDICVDVYNSSGVACLGGPAARAYSGFVEVAAATTQIQDMPGEHLCHVQVSHAHRQTAARHVGLTSSLVSPTDTAVIAQAPRASSWHRPRHINSLAALNAEADKLQPCSAGTASAPSLAQKLVAG